MSNQELLQENRAQGWESALTAPPRFAARIIEVRRALLEKRSVPAPSREYVHEAELRYAAAPRYIRKVNPLPAPLLSRNELLRKALRQAEQIAKDFGRDPAAELKAARLSNRVDEMFADAKAGRTLRFDGGQAADPQQLLRCSSMTASRQDHEWGAKAHINIARKICDRKESGWQDAADRHYRAADAHQSVIDANDDNYADRCGRACVACARAQQVMSQNGSLATK